MLRGFLLANCHVNPCVEFVLFLVVCKGRDLQTEDLETCSLCDFMRVRLCGKLFSKSQQFSQTSRNSLSKVPAVTKFYYEHPLLWCFAFHNWWPRYEKRSSLSTGLHCRIEDKFMVLKVSLRSRMLYCHLYGSLF